MPAYNENSIKIYKNLEGIRKRPSMYIGDVNKGGYHHLVFELIDNSLDEATMGCCNKIELFFNNDGSVKITDNGRGIPVKKHPTEKISTLDVVMTMLHAGGKFDDKDSAFKYSSGLHGVGASVVNALSEWMIVEVKRDGWKWQREYKKGIPVGKNIKKLEKVKKKDTGTTITFIPDNSIFKCNKFDEMVIQRRLRELSFLNEGIEFVLYWQDKEPERYVSKEGLSGYVNYLLGNETPLHKTVGVKGKIENCNMSISFAYEDSSESKIHSFANNVPTIEGGVHYNAALDSLVKIIMDRSESELKKNNVSVFKSDVVEGLVMVISVQMQNPEFGGQTKTKLNNECLRKPFGEWMQSAFDTLFKKHKEISNIIIKRVVETAISRNSVKKAKSIQRKKSLLDMNCLASKLKDCTSNNPELCEVIIVEGDSAAGGMVEARDRKFQAILPLRGKVLNTLNQSLGKALENNEISSIISALGISINKNDIDISDLRYHKIIFACDADPDGSHIVCLLMTLFHKFMRKIIEDGHLYICEMPLFRVLHRGKSFYIKDNNELTKFVEKNRNEKIEISRFKGLGEMSVDELNETAMNPKTRTLRKIHIEDDIQTTEIVETLMGKDASKRKEFLDYNLQFDDNSGAN